MEGAPDPPELRGIIPNAFLHIFEKVGPRASGKERGEARRAHQGVGSWWHAAGAAGRLSFAARAAATPASLTRRHSPLSLLSPTPFLSLRSSLFPLRPRTPAGGRRRFAQVAVAKAGQQFLVRASYLEIYNEEVRDLLGKDPKVSLDLKENLDTGVYVKDLTTYVVKSAIEIDQVPRGRRGALRAAEKATSREALIPRPLAPAPCACLRLPRWIERR